MPKEGWRSITVNDDTLKKWEDTYDLNKKALKEKGIRSFGGFVDSVMYGVIHDPKILFAAIDSGNKMFLSKFSPGGKK